MHALASILKVAGLPWQKRQWKAFSKGEPAEHRMLVAHQGSMATGALAHAEKLFEEEMPFSLLRDAGLIWTNACLVFIMLSGTLCALEQIVFTPWAGYPFKVWQLLISRTTEFANELLFDPDCMKDAWTISFLKHFNTVGKLLDRECRAFLITIGTVVRFDTSLIECRNATLRRLSRCNGGTWGPDFLRVSMLFWFLRQRLMERHFNSITDTTSTQAKPKPVPKQRVRRYGKFKGSRVGGGGVYRELCGMYLRKKRGGLNKLQRRTLWRGANAWARSVIARGGQELEEATRVGVARTVSYRVQSCRKRRRTPLPGEAATSVKRRAGRSSGVVPDIVPQRHVVDRMCDIRYDAEGDDDPVLQQLAVPLRLATLDHINSLLRRDLESFDAIVKAEAIEEHAADEDLAMWSEARLKELAATIGPMHHVDSTCKTVCVPSAPEDNLDIVLWFPPATSIADAALNHFGKRKVVVDLLEKHHEVIIHKLLPKSKAKGVKATMCAMVAGCVCGQDLPLAFGHILTEWVHKGGCCEIAYQQLRLFVCISPACAEDADTPSLWFHVGYGNLNQSLFTLMPMIRVTNTDFDFSDVVTLQRPAESRGQHMFKALKSLGTNGHWNMEAFELHVSRSRVHRFTGGRALVRARDPRTAETLWPPLRNERLRRLPLTNRAKPDVKPKPKLVPVDDGDSGPILKRLNPGGWDLSSDGSSGGGGGGDGGGDDWELSSDGDSSQAPIPKPQPNPKPNPKPVARPVALAPRAPPVMPDVRRQRRPDFPQVVYKHYENKRKSYLRLSETHGKEHKDMRAVCGAHTGCTFSMNCKDYRPIGTLWGWLKVADQYISKEDHKTHYSALRERKLARGEFRVCGDPLVPKFFEAERQRQDGSSDEPS